MPTTTADTADEGMKATPFLKVIPKFYFHFHLNLPKIQNGIKFLDKMSYSRNSAALSRFTFTFPVFVPRLISCLAS